MEQQTPIAAPHHTETEAHEANRAITQVVTFPTALERIAGSEQCAGDAAVAGPFLAAIKGAQGEDEPVSTKLRKSGRIGAGVAAIQTSPEADRGDCTYFEELVERQKDGQRVYVGLVDVDTKDAASLCDEVFNAIRCDA
jgi:hypothetical protein